MGVTFWIAVFGVAFAFIAYRPHKDCSTDQKIYRLMLDEEI